MSRRRRAASPAAASAAASADSHSGAAVQLAAWQLRGVGEGGEVDHRLRLSSSSAPSWTQQQERPKRAPGQRGQSRERQPVDRQRDPGDHPDRGDWGTAAARSTTATWAANVTRAGAVCEAGDRQRGDQQAAARRRGRTRWLSAQRARDRGGEQRLGAAAGLLGAQAQGGLDRVRGRDSARICSVVARKASTALGAPPARAARRGPRGCRHHVADVLRDRAERRAEDREAGGPATSAPRCRRQASPRGAQRAARRAGARREDAGAESRRADSAARRRQRDAARASSRAPTSARRRTGGSPAPSRAGERPARGPASPTARSRTRRREAIAIPLAARADSATAR